MKHFFGNKDAAHPEPSQEIQASRFGFPGGCSNNRNGCCCNGCPGPRGPAGPTALDSIFYTKSRPISLQS